MAPPTYADLGKQARDLFSKNYRKTGLTVKIKPKDRKQQKHQQTSLDKICMTEVDPKTTIDTFSTSLNDDTPSNENKVPRINIFLSLLPLLSRSSQSQLDSSHDSNCDDDCDTNHDLDLGLVKLDVKTKTPSGVDFNVNTVSNNDTGRVNSALETKYFLKEYGLTLREKWNTDNILTSEVTFEDKVLQGLKLSGNCSFAPQSGKKTGTVKAAFKTDALHVNTDVDLDYAGAIIHGAAVLGYQGWLAGAQLSFDPTKNRLTRTNFAVGFSSPELIVHTNVNDGQEFAGSLYQKVNPNLESGVHMAWVASTNATRFGIGCVYRLDDNSTLRAKVSNTSQIGLGFTHRLRKGITMTLNALIDGKNFNQGGHKLGLGFELEA